MNSLLIAFSLVLFAGSLRAEPRPDPERMQELLDLLYQDCGSCHGLTLKGGLGPPLESKALAEKPRDFLVATILEGRSGTAMPPWSPFLTKDEAEWLVNYLRGEERTQK